MRIAAFDDVYACGVHGGAVVLGPQVEVEHRIISVIVQLAVLSPTLNQDQDHVP